MHYYKRNLGDYAKKAGRLTMLQHGAYTLLLDSCYDREQFPTLQDAIEWTWASTKEEVEAVEFVLKKFFVLEDGKYIQTRIIEEFEKYHENAETNKRIAREREAKRKEQRTNRAQSVNGAPPNQEPITNNHKTITINQEPLEPTASTLPKVKVPYQDIIQLFKALLPELPEPKVLTDKRKRTLSSMWNWVMTSKDEDGDRRATTEHEGLEYFRRFFTYARKNDFVMGKTGRTGSHSNWQADIDYLCSERGRQQVIERTNA